MKIKSIIKPLLFICGCSFSAGNASSQVRDMFYKQFTPHTNNCNATTDVFVEIGAGSLGFCIEKDERAADTWENAKNSCFSDGKRLPEPAEFAFACKNPPIGLTNMTNNFEWSSNNLQPLWNGSNMYQGAPVMGYSSCISASLGSMGSNYSSNAGSYETFAFRCLK